jgi:hypothetical protein
LFGGILSTGALLIACSTQEESPDAQIRDAIDTAKLTVEARDVFGTEALIAESYSDKQNRSRGDLVRMAAAYFLRHKNIHLLTRIDTITLHQDNQAEVTVFVAMANIPMTDFEALLDMRADLYRFDLVMQKNRDKWLLREAHWRQARIDDFVI